jgi:hypothetical protein
MIERHSWSSKIFIIIRRILRICKANDKIAERSPLVPGDGGESRRAME